MTATEAPRTEEVYGDRLLDEHEFSKVCGIPVATLRSMRARPELEGPPFIKIGRSVRYSLKAFDRYKESRTVDMLKMKRR
jgi:predicted DNA-binding transcriptional regulator AlpA